MRDREISAWTVYDLGTLQRHLYSTVHLSAEAAERIADEAEARADVLRFTTTTELGEQTASVYTGQPQKSRQERTWTLTHKTGTPNGGDSYRLVLVRVEDC